MSAGTTEVDVRFCQRGEVLSGSVEVASLGRLSGEVAQADGTIEFVVSASPRVDGKPSARVDVRGSVALTCQRCLGAMIFPLAARRELVFSDPPPHLEEEDDDADFVGPDARFGVLDLVEEEALLCLPMVPRHAQDDCPAGAGAQESVVETNPFAVLRTAGKH